MRRGFRGFRIGRGSRAHRTKMLFVCGQGLDTIVAHSCYVMRLDKSSNEGFRPRQKAGAQSKALDHTRRVQSVHLHKRNASCRSIQTSAAFSAACSSANRFPSRAMMNEYKKSSTIFFRIAEIILMSHKRFLISRLIFVRNPRSASNAHLGENVRVQKSFSPVEFEFQSR